MHRRGEVREMYPPYTRTILKQEEVDQHQPPEKFRNLNLRNAAFPLESRPRTSHRSVVVRTLLE